MRFLIREARSEDLLELQKLAKAFYLFNLPTDKEALEDKIQISLESFLKKLPIEKRNYLFVLEDLENKTLIGSSQILAAYDEFSHPYFLLQTQNDKKILKLSQDQEGKYQFGGLILLPEYRSTLHRLGALLTQIRYLYIGAFEEDFPSKIEVNLTGLIETKDEELFNHFWQEVGRKYYDISYHQALLEFCQAPKDFFQKFPKEIMIQVDELSKEAQKCLTGIHSETKPAYEALKRLGFEYRNKHHFLDGALYISAFKKDLAMIQNTSWMQAIYKDSISNEKNYFVGQQTDKGFKAFFTKGQIEQDIFYFNAEEHPLDLTQKIIVTPI